MPTSTNTGPKTTTRNPVGAMEGILHLPRTLKIANAVLRDARVSVLPKLMFVGGIVALLAALFTPEILAEVVLVVPGLGEVLTAIGIPIDGAIDWLALGLAASYLMNLFPHEIIEEHRDNVVSRGRPSGPIVDSEPPH